MKALMMRGIISQISSSISLIEDMEKPDYIGSFDIALFLNKAMGRGAETARIFTEDLVDWDVVPSDFREKPVALAKDLLNEVYSFEFRPSTDERFIDVEECSDLDGFFAPSSMEKYYTSDPTIRRAIAEYEDEVDTPPTTRAEERLSGYYTKDEYDEINGY